MNEMKVVKNVAWLPVDSLDPVGDTPGHGARPAGEHSHLAHVAVLLLDKLEEGGHVRPTKVVDGLESSEHGAMTQTLEMVLTDVEHGLQTIVLKIEE